MRVTIQSDRQGTTYCVFEIRPSAVFQPWEALDKGGIDRAVAAGRGRKISPVRLVITGKRGCAENKKYAILFMWKGNAKQQAKSI